MNMDLTSAGMGDTVLSMLDCKYNSVLEETCMKRITALVIQRRAQPPQSITVEQVEHEVNGNV
jgi:hypothetical protein